MVQSVPNDFEGFYPVDALCTLRHYIEWGPCEAQLKKQLNLSSAALATICSKDFGQNAHNEKELMSPFWSGAHSIWTKVP